MCMPSFKKSKMCVNFKFPNMADKKKKKSAWRLLGLSHAALRRDRGICGCGCGCTITPSLFANVKFDLWSTEIGNLPARFAGVLSFAALFLLDVEHLVAAGAGVVRVFEVVHEEGDQTAAQHQPAAEHIAHEQADQIPSVCCSDTCHESGCRKPPAAWAAHPPAADEE